MGTRPRATWIVCAGQLRDLTDGTASCPAGRQVALSACLDCHLLETLELERSPQMSCAADPPPRRRWVDRSPRGREADDPGLTVSYPWCG